MYETVVLCALWGLVIVTPIGLFCGVILSALAGRMPKDF